MMNTGAFAFLDCLGFKGVWKRRGVTPELILGFLKDAQQNALSSSPTMAMLQSNPVGYLEDPSIVFISDSIAISTRLKRQPHPPVNVGEAYGYLVWMALALSMDIYRRFAEGPAPLVLRGAITFGNHVAIDRFLLGPAVDEAADLAGTTEGGFVWLTPEAEQLLNMFVHASMTTYAQKAAGLEASKAIEVVEKMIAMSIAFGPATLTLQQLQPMIDYWKAIPLEKKALVAPMIVASTFENLQTPMLVRGYPMEMKRGGTLRAVVGNPLWRVPVDSHVEWIARTLSGFGTSPIDVLMKRQNTGRFYSTCTQVCIDSASKTMAHLSKLREKVSGMINA